MKTFDLSTTRVSNLNPTEIVELKQYLLTLSVREIANYLYNVIDLECTLSEDVKVQKKADKFLRDSIFNPAKDQIKIDIEEEERLEEIKEKKKLRQKKLREINFKNHLYTEIKINFPEFDPYEYDPNYWPSMDDLKL
jgi:hypothetical protein